MPEFRRAVGPQKQGIVYLVGAGPGDEGLLTVRGKQLLENAEVVVYDRLVGEGILSLIPSSAEKINVGKTAGFHPVPQSKINEILLEKAEAGFRVVRLKGGDSFVFGRGGEELELLKEHHIPFEVVPGITSAIAAAAYAGIPVTHRDYCSSLHIITGHKRENGSLDLDYDALVRLKGTLIFLMSVSNLEEILHGLCSHGLPAVMPCALVENGTRPNQRKVIASAAAIVKQAAAAHIVSPSILIVGKVCALSEQFDWFSHTPLKGKRILVTRPKAVSRRLADRLKEMGAQVDLAPAIETVPMDFDMPDIISYTGLVFTSAAGVNAFFERWMADGKDARQLAGKRVFCVGRETAKQLLAYGIQADFVPTAYSGEALAQELLAAHLVTQADRLLLLRGDRASRELPEILKQAAIPLDEAVVYATHVLPLSPIEPAAYDYVTFTSASCVEGFAEAAAGKALTGVKALCIGEQTAAAARGCGMQVMVSPEATIDGMITWIGGMEHD